jgi:aryl-alcohol dehydrogenase-like predicted oxidoreductase
MIDHRPLGSSGLATPALILGGNVFGWTADEAASFAILDAFVEGGGVMIDTADVYSAWAPGHKGGESETVIGRWLERSGKRERVQIATKVGMMAGLAPERIAAACDASLRRLGVETIDLYYAHKDDAGTPLADTLGAFDALVRAGKVRALGASNYEATRLAEALDASAADGLAAYSVLQPWYNMVERARFEGPLRDLCMARGIGVAPYYSLANGFLTGKYRSEADLGKSVRARETSIISGRKRAHACWPRWMRWRRKRAARRRRSRSPGPPRSPASPRRSRARRASRSWRNCWAPCG